MLDQRGSATSLFPSRWSSSRQRDWWNRRSWWRYDCDPKSDELHLPHYTGTISFFLPRKTKQFTSERHKTRVCFLTWFHISGEEGGKESVEVQEAMGEVPRAGKTFQSTVPWGIEEEILGPRASWHWCHGLPAFSSVAICPNNDLEPRDCEVEHGKPPDEEKTVLSNWWLGEVTGSGSLSFLKAECLLDCRWKWRSRWKIKCVATPMKRKPLCAWLSPSTGGRKRPGESAPEGKWAFPVVVSQRWCAHARRKDTSMSPLKPTHLPLGVSTEAGFLEKQYTTEKWVVCSGRSWSNFSHTFETGEKGIGCKFHH